MKYFGRVPKYSVLVFDNRGVGNSTTPRGPYTYGDLTYVSDLSAMMMFSYSTSGMAEDTIALLNYVGWLNGKRNLHVVSASLGGMIAQGCGSVSLLSRALMLTPSRTSIKDPRAHALANACSDHCWWKTLAKFSSGSFF